MAFHNIEQLLDGTRDVAQLTSSEIAMAMHTLAKRHPQAGDQTAAIERLILSMPSAFQHRLHEFNPNLLSVFAWSICRLAQGVESPMALENTKGLIVEAARTAQSALHSFTPKSICNIAFSLAKVDTLSHPGALSFIRVASAHSAALITDWPAHAVSNFCFVLGELGMSADTSCTDAPKVKVKALSISGSTLAQLQVPTTWTIRDVRQAADHALCTLFCSIGDVVQVSTQRGYGQAPHSPAFWQPGVVMGLVPLRVNNVQTGVALDVGHVRLWKAQANGVVFAGRMLKDDECLDDVFNKEEENIVYIIVSGDVTIGVDFAEAASSEVRRRISEFNWQDLCGIISSLHKGGLLHQSSLELITEVVALAAGRCSEMTTTCMLTMSWHALSLGVDIEHVRPMVEGIAAELQHREVNRKQREQWLAIQRMSGMMA